MAFTEMLSDASLLNLLIEMLMMEILRGHVSQSQRTVQESAQTHLLCGHKKRGTFPKSVHLPDSPCKSLGSRSVLSIYFKYLRPSFIAPLHLAM